MPSGFWRVSTQQPTRKKNTIEQKKNMQQDAMLYTSWYIYKKQSSNHHQIRWCSSPLLPPSPPHLPPSPPISPHSPMPSAAVPSRCVTTCGLPCMAARCKAVSPWSAWRTRSQPFLGKVPRGPKMVVKWGDKLPKNMRIWRLDEFRSKKTGLGIENMKLYRDKNVYIHLYIYTYIHIYIYIYYYTRKRV